MPTLIPHEGEVVTLKDFAYTNKHGGTSTYSAGQPQRVYVVKAWEDSETGWNFHGTALSDGLITYMHNNAHGGDQRVLFSQWDVLTVESVKTTMHTRNRFTDLTNTIEAPMRRKILALAKKEFPGRMCDITVKYRKFYFLDRPGHIVKLVVDIQPFDLQPGEEAAHYAELGEEQNPPSKNHPFPFPRD